MAPFRYGPRNSAAIFTEVTTVNHKPTQSHLRQTGAMCATTPEFNEIILRPRGAIWATNWLQFFPPRQIVWRTVRLPIVNLPPSLEGLRVLHISDLHFRKWYSRAWNLLLEKIAATPPDLILITGDYVDSKRNPYPALPLARKFLNGLRARDGIFGIVGNHDDYVVAYKLRDTPLTFIDGKRILTDVRQTPIELIGLPGGLRFDLEPALIRSFPPRDQAVPRIVLSHYPDHLRYCRGLKSDLFLAGHTHGGQVCLPGGIPIIKHDALPRGLTHGIHHVDGTWLVVSRGLGSTGLPIRVFCPPEVSEMELTAGLYANDGTSSRHNP